MTPQLATKEEVQEAANAIVNVEARIVEKQDEIAKTKVTIESLTVEISTLKSQL